jgi:hypothetical protein
MNMNKSFDYKNYLDCNAKNRKLPQGGFVGSVSFTWMVSGGTALQAHNLDKVFNTATEAETAAIESFKNAIDERRMIFGPASRS